MRARGPPLALVPAAGRPDPRPGVLQFAEAGSRAAVGAERRVGPGEVADQEFLERDQLEKRPGESAADVRPTGVLATGPRRRAGPLRPAPKARGMARGPALLLLCARVLWAAAALLLFAPQTSGRTRAPAGSPGWSPSLSSFPARGPPAGLLPIRRVPRPAKCFQRPCGRRRGEPLASRFRGL